MTLPQDYRSSHVERGPIYDATLAANAFDAYMTAWERRHLLAVVSSAFPQGVPRYLDFACGTGRVTEIVASVSTAAAGVDVSDSMLAVARQRLPDAQFVHGDLTESDCVEGLFDLVTAFRFFGNADPSLRSRAIAAIAAKIRPGGFFVANSHRNPNALYAVLSKLRGAPPHDMDLSLGKFTRLLRSAGLEPVRIIPIGAWMYRARLLESYGPEDPTAVRNEARFGHPIFARIAPDAIVVAQRRSAP